MKPVGTVGHLLRLTVQMRLRFGVIGNAIICVRPTIKGSFLAVLPPLLNSQRANWVSRVALNSMMTMNKKAFAKLLNRDGHCWHCGSTGDNLIPQHRANRGHGGASKISKLNQPSNLIVLCSDANFMLENLADFAERGRLFGWKISRYADPATEPVYDAWKGVWCILTNDYERIELHNYGVTSSSVK